MRARLGDLVVGRWGARFRGRRFACSIGRAGITRQKQEGDGATPAGVWRLTGFAYRADRGRLPLTDRSLDGRSGAIGPADIWSDDPADPNYNRGFRARWHPFGHERMRRGDGLYDLVAITDWNWPDATPGQGSAIFIHCWKSPRKPTAGCVAFRRRDLEWILARWTARSRVIVYP